MKRVRWLKTDFVTSIDTIADQLKKYHFNINGVEGFFVDKIRSNYLDARYIEKLIHQEMVKDPFGNEEFFDRITYKETQFKLIDSFPHIELYNPPRSINTFINKLLEINNYSASLDYVAVDLLEWVNILKEKIKNSVTITSVQVSELKLEKGIFAKVLIQGDRDVKKYLGDFVSGKTYKLDKVKLLVGYEKSIFPVYLSANASANFSEIYFDQILPLLRASLMLAYSSKHNISTQQ